MIQPPPPPGALTNPVGTTMAVVQDGSDVIVSWAGGFSPYQLLTCSPLSPKLSDWKKVGNPTIALSKRVPISLGEQYFYVQQSVPMMDAAVTDSMTHLFWTVPDLF